MSVSLTNEQAIGTGIINDIGSDAAGPVNEDFIGQLFDPSWILGGTPVNDNYIDELISNYNAALASGISKNDMNLLSVYLVNNDSQGQTTTAIANSFLKQISTGAGQAILPVPLPELFASGAGKLLDTANTDLIFVVVAALVGLYLFSNISKGK